MQTATSTSLFLDQQVKDRDYKIVSAAYTANFPIGIYSKMINSLNELMGGRLCATVAAEKKTDQARA